MIADNTTHDAIFIIFAPYSRRYTLALCKAQINLALLSAFCYICREKSSS